MEIVLDWIYPFQAISSNFGFSLAKKLPLRRKTGKFLDWIYPFQGISSNFGISWQLSSPPPGAKQGKFFRLDLLISGNFQQLWVQLAVKFPQ